MHRELGREWSFESIRLIPSLYDVYNLNKTHFFVFQGKLLDLNHLFLLVFLVNATMNYGLTCDKIKPDSGVGSARLCGWCPTPGFAVTVM